MITEGITEATSSESHDIFLDIVTSSDEYNPASDDRGSSSDRDDGGNKGTEFSKLQS